MNLGFYIILSAQFLSSLADNALLFVAIALLMDMGAPPWHTPVLQQFFVISYIILAPFVGAFADALPKGRVMFISNSVKLFGCLVMLAGANPLYAYAIVGLGAAAYSPAKYGILTEYLPPAKLVEANAWIEGATVAAIVLGAILGGNILEGGHTSSLLQLTAFIIVAGGTVGAIMIQVPLHTFLRSMHMAAWVFKPPRQAPQEAIGKIVEWSNIARREGLLGLENIAEQEVDLFARKGLQLLVDGNEPEAIRGILEVDLESQEYRDTQAERHRLRNR